MKYKFNNNIRVFYRQPETVGKTPESGISGIEKIQVDAFIETTLINLLKLDKQDQARKYLNEQRKKSELLSKNVSAKCIMKLQILTHWIEGRSIFGAYSDTKNKISDNLLNDILKSVDLQKSDVKKIRSQESEDKAVTEFQKRNPIQEYKSKLVDFCLQHPQQATRGWRIGKLLGQDNFSLENELEKVNKLGGINMREYRAVLETLISIVKTPEFDKYTGKWDTKEVSAEDLRLYKKGLNDTIDRVILSGKSEQPQDILSVTKENERRIQKEVLEAEKRIRSKITPEIIIEIFESSNSRDEIQKKLGVIYSTTFGKDYQIYGKHGLGEKIKDILAIYETANTLSKNSILEGDTIGSLWSGNTKADFLIKAREALNIAQKTKEEVKVDIGNKDGKGTSKFEVYDTSELKIMFENPEGININIWKGLMNESSWEGKLINIVGSDSLWAVGQYMADKQYDTNLLNKLPNPRKGEVRDFFQKKLMDHKLEIITTDKKIDNYTARIYEKIKDLIPGISLAEYSTIAPGGVIKSKLLYEKVKRNNPQEYITFEKQLIQRGEAFEKELTKEIAEAAKRSPIKTYGDLEKKIKEKKSDFTFDSTVEKNMELANVGDKEARKILDLLDTYPEIRDDNPELIKLLEGQLNRAKVNAGVGRSKAVITTLEKDGEAGLKKIVSGDTERIEKNAGKAYVAQKETIYQIEAIKEDINILTLLQEYGYTPEMLKNPLSVQSLYAQVLKKPASQNRNKLLSYLKNIKGNQEEQIRSYDAIIKEVGNDDAVKYISSISGRKESAQSIEAYKVMNQSIIKNVEYPHGPLSNSLAMMSPGQVIPLSRFTENNGSLNDSFVHNYSISLKSPNSYEIQSNTGIIIANALDIDQVDELVDDMSLLDTAGLGDLIPVITDIKKQTSLANQVNTQLDGQSTMREKRMLLQNIYQILFGETLETTDIHELIRGFQSKLIGANDSRTVMRSYLKTSGLMREDNTLASRDIIIGIFNPSKSIKN